MRIIGTDVYIFDDEEDLVVCSPAALLSFLIIVRLYVISDPKTSHELGNTYVWNISFFFFMNR